MHNNLRITRILKSLGELGFEHYQAPLVRFFLEETLVKKTLSSVKRSVLDYFLFAVLDKQKRQELLRFAYSHFEPKDKFVWCPRKVQKQFRKAEKRADGDGKDDACSRSRSKDGEAVVQQKEDGMDGVPRAQKGTDKTASKDKNKVSEASPETPPEAETLGNGNADSNDVLGNGHDSADDVDEMDQSSSPDSAKAKSEPCADSEDAATKDAAQEADSVMQTDEDVDTEKPPKKKREDNKELHSNGSAGDSASEETKEKAAANKAAGQTPPKTSKHSPCLSSGREEKIPRTDFNQAPDKRKEEETSKANVSATNGSGTSNDGGQTNGKESEDVDMESNPSSSEQNVKSS